MQDAIAERNEYVDFWNEILVPKFVRWKHILVGGLTHHSAEVFPSLAVREGDRVVDVGCGFGDTAIELARRVGPAGCGAWDRLLRGLPRVRPAGRGGGGLDERRVRRSGRADLSVPGRFDFCFSRFGTQFFENPVAALRNMRSRLKPGGTMTMIVWREIDDNPWLGMPKEIVLRFLPPPGEDARSCGPGPFSMADPEVVTKQLEIAGYRGSSSSGSTRRCWSAGRRDAVDFQLALGPAGEVYREAGELAERQRDAIAAALTAELARYETAEGIMMQSSSWKVTARNPG